MAADLTQILLQGLQNNTLFNTSSVSNAQNFAAFINQLGSILTTDPSLSTYANQLNSLTSSQLASLEQHLTDQFANIIGNLGIVDSYSNAATSYGLPVTMQPSDYFSSITGGSDSLIGQSLNQASQFIGNIGGAAATSIIGAVEGAIANGSITNSGIQSTIQSIGGSKGALSLLQNLNPTGMAQLSNVVQQLSSNPLAAFGSASSIIGNIGQLGNVSGILGQLSSNMSSLGNIGGIANIGSLLNNQGGMLTSLQSMISGFGPSGLTSLFSGSLGSSLSSVLSGNLTGGLGSLTGSMGSIGSLISGEQTALTGAVSGLTNIAGAGALSNLIGSSSPLSGVLGSIGGPSMQAALGQPSTSGVQPSSSPIKTDTSNDSNPCSPCTIPNSSSSSNNQSSSNNSPSTNNNPTPNSVATPAGTNTAVPARASSAGIGSDANIPLTPSRSTSGGIGSDALADANGVSSQSASPAGGSTTTAVSGAGSSTGGYGQFGNGYNTTTPSSLGNENIDEYAYAGPYAVPKDIQSDTGLRFGFGGINTTANNNLTQYYGAK